MTFPVPVDTKNPSYTAPDIRYRVDVTGHAQARLKNRYIVTPQIDFRKFRCTAVIDWIEIRLVTVFPSQFRHVKTTLSAAGTGIHVKAIDLMAGGSSHIFIARIQEPNIAALHIALEAINSRNTFDSIPSVTSIEISIDFYSKRQSDNDLLQLVRLLGQHLHISDSKVLSSKMARPRCVSGSGKYDTTRLFPATTNPKRNRWEYPLLVDEDEPPIADGTLYFGQKGGPAMWRIMFKKIDQQNRTTGTHRDLSPKERRARIEVTLNREELQRIEINNLDDLVNGGMTRFKRYFRFMLPSFANDNPIISPSTAGEWRERRRWDKFKGTGVFGLNAMDLARERQSREILAQGRRLGYPLREQPRIGTGNNSLLVFYRELSKRAETALRHLDEKTKK